jgi:hypothetical protein
MITLAHKSTSNHTTILNYASEHEAQIMAYRMRRSPKTRSVALYHSVLASAQYPASEPELATAGSTKPENAWFKVWNWIGEHCRWAYRR